MDRGLQHVQLFFSVEEVVERKVWDSGAGGDELEASSGFHGGRNGGEG